jgi:nicotinamidase-related amidase
MLSGVVHRPAVALAMAMTTLAATTAAPLQMSRPAAAQELPSLPEPVAVTLDPSTTAFLVLDMSTATCSPRPACVDSLAPVARLLAAARAANVLVVYSSTTAPGATILPEVAALPTDPVVVSSADKFFNTPLDEILRMNGIETAIMVGTASNGAPMYTAFGANLRGYTVVVAEDGISGTNDFQTFLARYQLLNQPGYSNADNQPLRERAVTLSRTDLIDFQPVGLR